MDCCNENDENAKKAKDNNNNNQNKCMHTGTDAIAMRQVKNDAAALPPANCSPFGLQQKSNNQTNNNKIGQNKQQQQLLQVDLPPTVL